MSSKIIRQIERDMAFVGQQEDHFLYLKVFFMFEVDANCLNYSG